MVYFKELLSQNVAADLACGIKWVGVGGGLHQVQTVSPAPPLLFFLALPLCVLVSEGAQEKQRISSVLAGDDPRGSCTLKLGKAGLANPKPPE